jgi:hypothetical protein
LEFSGDVFSLYGTDFAKYVYDAICDTMIQHDRDNVIEIPR